MQVTKKGVAHFFYFCVFYSLSFFVFADSTQVVPLKMAPISLQNFCNQNGGWPNLANNGTVCEMGITSIGNFSTASLANSPAIMTLGSSNQTSLTGFPVDGLYSIMFTLQLAPQTTPAYIWVDQWADVIPYQQNNAPPAYPQRIFYSGDSPIILNSNNLGSTTPIPTVGLYYSGIVYLRKDSVVHAPRIWTTNTDPTTGGVVSLQWGNNCYWPPGSGNNTSCLYISLLN